VYMQIHAKKVRFSILRLLSSFRIARGIRAFAAINSRGEKLLSASETRLGSARCVHASGYSSSRVPLRSSPSFNFAANPRGRKEGSSLMRFCTPDNVRLLVMSTNDYENENTQRRKNRPALLFARAHCEGWCHEFRALRTRLSITCRVSIAAGIYPRVR